MRRHSQVMAALFVGLALLGWGCGDGDSVNSSRAGTPGFAGPTLEGPVSGGSGRPFVAATTFDLAEVGYSEAEYFLSGTATAYANDGPVGEDGRWSVTPAATAAYKTRMVVYRPLNRARFNGTVVVEWLNVSGGLDAAAVWLMGHVELVRAGFAWVGVSAQQVGVDGGGSLLGLAELPLKTVDPERYRSLSHPGDSFSYDIFTQTAHAVRRRSGLRPLGDLDVQNVLGVGVSQSAFRLVTYVNAIHPLARSYDGYLIQSRGGFASTVAPLSQVPLAAIDVPGTALTREDIDVPVLTLETETDLGFLQYGRVRQEDGERFRLWEVAGSAHADTYTVAVGPTDLGQSAESVKLFLTSKPTQDLECSAPINSGPLRFVVNSALAALDRWVRDGTPAPHAPRLQLRSNSSLRIARDAHGIALGGIRTPPVDAPIATLSGEGGGSIFCSLFGRTVPFDAATLAALYPDQAAYVAAVGASAERAVEAGFLRPADAELLKAAAETTDISGF